MFTCMYSQPCTHIYKPVTAKIFVCLYNVFELQIMLHVRRSSRKRKSISVCEPSQAAAARRTTTTATVPVRSQPPRIAPATAAPQDHDTHTPVSQGPVFVSLGSGCSSQLPPSVSTPGNATVFQLSPSTTHMDPCQIAPSVSHITSNSLPQLTTVSTCVAPQPIMSINNDVSSTVPKNIKDKIINGEFIDLATLCLMIRIQILKNLL